MRRLLVLGSTGSVGTSTLDVVRTLSDRFRVVGLAAHSSVETLIAQAREFGVTTIALADDDAAERARALAPELTVLGGSDAASDLVRSVEAEVVLQATVGAAALPSTVAAIEAGRLIALANKECLVMAGTLLLEMATRTGATVIPVDSEHSAIFQCLRSGGVGEVERIILTASGGSFRDRPLDELAAATPAEALCHPTWSMGPRITVDSATMMNKALEVAEAVALFGVTPDQVRVVVHPQSIVHSMVEFRDGSVIAQMSRPDMRLPIVFALAYPERPLYEPVRFNVTDFSNLTFRDPDPERYPLLELGYEAARRGGTAGAVLNAADEEAVGLFLGGEIGFAEINHVVQRVFETCAPSGGDAAQVAGSLTLEDVLAADRAAREEVLACRLS